MSRSISIIKNIIKRGGCILIADVAFQTRSDLEKGHKENKDGWDGIYKDELC